MPQPETPEAAASIEERNIKLGADVLKLFTGSIVKPHEVLPMPVEIATAAVEVAHRHGQLALRIPPTWLEPQSRSIAGSTSSPTLPARPPVSIPHTSNRSSIVTAR